MSTPEEILGALREMANDSAIGDAFRVKIDHRGNPAAMPTRFAIFQNVPFEFIVAPEPWIEQLTGSARGIYELSISHESNPSKVIGGALRVPLTAARTGGDPKFQWAVLDSESYRGPRDVVYPTRAVESSPPTTAIPLATIRPPAAAPATPQQDLAGLVSAIANVARPPAAPPAGPDPMLRWMEMQREDRKQEEARRQQEKDERERREEREREREEQRRREEREREERREKEERDREERREQREREHQARLAEQQQKSQELMVQILTKKDPVVDQLIAKSLAGNDEASARAAGLIQQMSGFMTQMTAMTVQLLHTQAELSSGPQESPIWGLARTALEGYFQMAGTQESEVQEALAEATGQKSLGAGEPQPEQSDAAEAETEEESEEISLEKPLERFDRAIREMAPLGELADALCLVLPTPEFQALVAEAKGDLRQLIQKRYISWIESKDIADQKERAKVAGAKVKYLSQQLPKAYHIAQQRGVIRAPPTTPAAAAQKHTRAEPQKKKVATKKEEVPAKKEEAAPSTEVKDS